MGSSATSYALILWAYDKVGTATSITWLSACSYIPSVFFCFAAGVLVDRLDKKRIMLFADLAAFFCTFTVYILYLTGTLQVWHLYVVNFTVSCAAAFQNPASYVATSLLVPKEQYTRIGGLQAFSGAVVSILPPVFATAMLSFAGIEFIFLVDFATFFFAFFSLLFFIKIPAAPKSGKEDVSFFKNSILGLRFLKEHRVLLRLILFFAGINFLASLAGTQLLPALILPRSGQNSVVLGAVSSAVGIGSLAGSVLVTILPTPRRRMPVIFTSCALSFLLCNIPWAIGQTAWIWIAAAILGNLPLPFLNANLSAIMRNNVPLSMQGRVFAARDTVQYCTIPIGIALGGLLTDRIFEPLMQNSTCFTAFLVGQGAGSGAAMLFLLTGIAGVILSLLALKQPAYCILEEADKT